MTLVLFSTLFPVPLTVQTLDCQLSSPDASFKKTTTSEPHSNNLFAFLSHSYSRHTVPSVLLPGIPAGVIMSEPNPPFDSHRGDKCASP